MQGTVQLINYLLLYLSFETVCNCVRKQIVQPATRGASNNDKYTCTLARSTPQGSMIERASSIIGACCVCGGVREVPVV